MIKVEKPIIGVNVFLSRSNPARQFSKRSKVNLKRQQNDTDFARRVRDIQSYTARHAERQYDAEQFKSRLSVEI